jgi:hypothetical protein
MAGRLSAFPRYPTLDEEPPRRVACLRDLSKLAVSSWLHSEYLARAGAVPALAVHGRGQPGSRRLYREYRMDLFCDQKGEGDGEGDGDGDDDGHKRRCGGFRSAWGARLRWKQAGVGARADSGDTRSERWLIAFAGLLLCSSRHSYHGRIVVSGHCSHSPCIDAIAAAPPALTPPSTLPWPTTPPFIVLRQPSHMNMSQDVANKYLIVDGSSTYISHY